MQGITLTGMERNFPYPRPRTVQVDALRHIVEADRGVLLEIPTGEGKTGIGVAALQAASEQGEGLVMYVTPSKVQLEQVREVIGPRRCLPLLGRAEHPCLYYEDRGMPGVTAQESPCYTLDCVHRVDQATGQTQEPTAEPCPYFLAKYQARTRAGHDGIIVCTTAGFLTNRLLDSRWAETPLRLVVFDEVHRLATVARGVFEYTMTDYHLGRAVALLRDVLGARKAARAVSRFRAAFMRIARRRNSHTHNLLTEEQISQLLALLEELDEKDILNRLQTAVRGGQIDSVEQKTELKLIENLARNIPRFRRGLAYSLPDEEEGRGPLNYIVAFYYSREDPEFAQTGRRVRYYLTIKPYFVAGLIRKACGTGGIVGMSATIGNPQILGYETGFRRLPFHSFGSNFPIGRTAIYLPTDAPNLAMRVRRRQDLNRTLRRIVKAALEFARRGHRSLVVVVSDEERRKFLSFAQEAGLEAVSYGDNGVTARQAATAFKEGQGQVLVGTTAQYGEGVDLPDGLAPVIFFLRPGYPRPDDPQAQFEQRRFSQGHCWALWKWRVMIQALQVRGRNVRTARDLGVCFFMSAQFREFLYASLPEWLQPAYKGNLAMEAAAEDALKVLGQ